MAWRASDMIDAALHGSLVHWDTNEWQHPRQMTEFLRLIYTRGKRYTERFKKKIIILDVSRCIGRIEKLGSYIKSLDDI